MIETFSRYGYKYTEISDEHGEQLIERANPEKVGYALRKYAEDCGFQIPQGHLLLKADIVDPSANNREKTINLLKQWLELFCAIGVKACVLHPGGGKASAEGWSQEKIFDTRVESLRILTDFIKDMPTAIAMENCGSYGNNIDDSLRVINAVNSDNIGICLDTGHLNLINGNQDEFIRKSGSKLLALHIADNLGIYDDHMLPYSKGTVDWNSVLKALKDISYSGLFNFEVPGERFCPAEIKKAKIDYILQLGNLMTK